ncbi:MAG TPA: bifunctional 4-hydroxy-2-oxoglutarate aldolase/2-dehydro-3-deoxy-phosphogluconate aldolase [Spirochaetota bacterium]|nr:bifunctional 4-hydroxy-2-oxoglutarate aldolase/2-dehydro-3-deoxy-phosphogluconate aldolase [Spirochaetota bacterium]HOM08787.1 bifunctional 4-hydroxy-2-oxoglutarate aldolase/2-dehydro-3-deoxy-phosphogluconate aldolase [Spirochaetota bacterium]HPP50172.1 bifunctional 4-hydroxy-2-oxoglutarate aldolase/2-dehydro-3-deoxy-phosphogluconate aldolase [Spirochaetota bacterium]
MQFKLTVPVIPIGVFSDSSKIVTIAEILHQHGIHCIEVTLRTTQALACISALKKSFPQMLVGAGSVLRHDDFKAAIDAGATFVVSPSISDSLIELSHRFNDIQYIPGFTTPTELAHALQLGCTILKFFPAEYAGGVKYLKAITEPFVKYSFSIIPTGGIMPSSIKQYLAIPNVIACGMSYIVDSTLIDANDFHALEDRIKETLDSIIQ